MFWCLDAYYLSQERKFRSLYESARKASSTDFGMSTKATEQPRDTWSSAFFSTTMVLFHGAIIAVISFVMWKMARDEA